MTFWRKRKESDKHADQRIREAQEKACDLEVRSERVSESLKARLKRNHWGQTVAEIARGER